MLGNKDSSRQTDLPLTFPVSAAPALLKWEGVDEVFQEELERGIGVGGLAHF